MIVMGEDIEVVLIKEARTFGPPLGPAPGRTVGQGEEPEAAPYELTEDGGNWDDHCAWVFWLVVFLEHDWIVFPEILGIVSHPN